MSLSKKNLALFPVLVVVLGCFSPKEGSVRRELNGEAEVHKPIQIITLPLSASGASPLQVEEIPTPAPTRKPKKPTVKIEDEIELAPWVNEMQRANVDSRELAKQLVNQGIEAIKAKQIVSAIVYFRKARLIDPKFLSGWLYELNALRAMGLEGEKKRVLYRLKLDHPDLASRIPNSVTH